MCNYVYKRNKDGVHYLDISKTWEKIMVAARVIAATQAKNPKDVLVSKKLITLFFITLTRPANDFTKSERVRLELSVQSRSVDKMIITLI